MCARAGRFVLLSALAMGIPACCRVSALATGIQPAAGHRVWKKGDMDFSLVVPCFNEADNLPTFIAAATSALDKTGMSYELVFVNDGSTDGTAAVLSRELDGCSGTHAAFTVVEFSRNFGKESAMYAGLERATGDCVGFIDADMQQDPAVAIEMSGSSRTMTNMTAWQRCRKNAVRAFRCASSSACFITCSTTSALRT